LSTFGSGAASHADPAKEDHLLRCRYRRGLPEISMYRGVTFPVEMARFLRLGQLSIDGSSLARPMFLSRLEYERL
jgi:hypothetical protein